MLKRLSCILLGTMALVLVAGPVLAATGEPLPGVDIIVRKHPPKPTKLHVGGGGGGGGVIVIEAGVFGPGSQPFVGDVDLQFHANTNIGTVGHVDHGRIDFVEGATPDLLVMQMDGMILRSITPLEISYDDGSLSYEDAWIEIMRVAGGPSDPIEGQLALPVGTVLDPGSTSFVVDSFFDVEYDIYFTDATTGAPAGPTFHGTMQLLLEEPDLPIYRLDAGSGGNVCPGYDGSTLFDYTFSSPDGSLSLGLDTVLPSAPVEVEMRSLGAVKGLYR